MIPLETILSHSPPTDLCPDLWWCAFLARSVMNLVPSTNYSISVSLRARLEKEPPLQRVLPPWNIRKRWFSITARFFLSCVRFSMRSPLRLLLVVVCKPWSRTVGFSCISFWTMHTKWLWPSLSHQRFIPTYWECFPRFHGYRVLSPCPFFRCGNLKRVDRMILTKWCSSGKKSGTWMSKKKRNQKKAEISLWPLKWNWQLHTSFFALFGSIQVFRIAISIEENS